MCVSTCMCRARRSHAQLLLPGAVVCFLSVKSYTANIQNIFRCLVGVGEQRRSHGPQGNNVYCLEGVTLFYIRVSLFSVRMHFVHNPF